MSQIGQCIINHTIFSLDCIFTDMSKISWWGVVTRTLHSKILCAIVLYIVITMSVITPYLLYDYKSMYMILIQANMPDSLIDDILGIDYDIFTGFLLTVWFLPSIVIVDIQQCSLVHNTKTVRFYHPK